MGQVLHKSATTTHRIRQEIQEAKESINALAKRFNINPKTVSKWKNRVNVDDLACGSKKGQGSVLSEKEEWIIVETRTKSLLALDDLYDVLKPEIAALTRSNLHRCLQRHGISRLEDLLPEEEKKTTKTFKSYEPGYVHIDTAQINLGKEKWYLFVAIDRATRYAYIEVHDNKTMQSATEFLETVLVQYPFTIYKILTDNGMEFSYNPLPECTKPKDKVHPFVALCKQNNIEHRTTLVKHPWTNGMVEAMNKKIKANTIKRFYYENITVLKEHLYSYLLNYNFNLKLRALGRLTPFEKIQRYFEEKPELFKTNLYHLSMGSNS